jgi:predicted nucleotidyltransferase
MVREVTTRVALPRGRIEEFCRKRGVLRLELFGSVLRPDFSSERSDVDVLVTLTPGRKYTMIDIIRMEDELSRIFGRPVELTERSTVESSGNYIRRRHILAEAQLLYER